jgi:hypothetical protein
MAKAKERAPLKEEALGGLAREPRKEALDCLKALLKRREGGRRRESEERTKLGRREFSPLLLNHRAKSGEARGGEGGHGSESERIGEEEASHGGGQRSGASEEAEARGSLEKSRAGGLRQRGRALPGFSQRGEEQRARRGRRERLGERRGEPLKRRGQRAKEGRETASSLPEAKRESMAKSQRKEERLESFGGDRLPWERGQSLERVRDGREGARSAQRRGEHGKECEEEARGVIADADAASCCARLRATLQRKKAKARSSGSD